MNRNVKLVEDVKMKTKAYTYVLPLLCRELDLKKMLSLINVYIRHESYPELNNHIFCLYEWNSNRIHTSFEQELMNSPLCVKHEDVSSKHYMMCFKVNDNMQHNYDQFIKGKYSKMTQEYKNYLIDFFSLSKDHAVTMVLNKDRRLKQRYEEFLGTKLGDDAELSSVIDIERETFKPSFIKQSESPLPMLSRL